MVRFFLKVRNATAPSVTTDKATSITTNFLLLYLLPDIQLHKSNTS